MKQFNDLLDDMTVDPINCSQLLYNNEDGGKGNPVSKVANPNNTKEQQHVYKEQQHVCNEDLAMKRAPNSNEHVYNMQIPYDVNQALDPKSWDGNFYTILLYGSIEHLASDAKNIKESLCFMQKYILNKAINGDKVNDIKDLEGIGEVAWRFIFTLYKLYQDNLIVDKNNFFFRCKVKA